MEGWVTKSLGEFFTIVTGGTPSKSNPDYFGGNVPFIKPGDLLDNDIENVAECLTDEGQKQVRSLPPDSICVSCIGNLGKLGVTSTQSATNQQINSILPDPKVAIPKFVFYLCLTGDFKDQLHSRAGGTTVPIVNKGRFSSIQVSIPPLTEQRRIVAILDEAFAAIETATAAAEKNLANARELFERSLDDLIAAKAGADNSEKLGSLVDRLTNGYVGPTRNIYLEMGIPYLLARHVRDNRLEFDGRTYVSDGFNLKNKKSMLKAGDVLLVQSGHIGHSAVVPPEHEGHNCHAMIVITPKKDVLVGAYLSLLFNTRRMRGVFASIRSGSTVPHLTCREVRLLDIPLPSAAAQEELVTASEQLAAPCEVLKAIFIRKLALLGELKQSLLQKAFRGEL